MNARSSLVTLSLVSGTASLSQTSGPAERQRPYRSRPLLTRSDVQHVIDAYHEAVLTHDGNRLASLFLPQGSLWLAVLSDDAYERAKARKPDVQKVHVGSYTDFVKLVSNQKVSLNPTHTPTGEQRRHNPFGVL